MKMSCNFSFPLIYSVLQAVSPMGKPVLNPPNQRVFSFVLDI